MDKSPRKMNKRKGENSFYLGSLGSFACGGKLHIPSQGTPVYSFRTNIATRHQSKIKHYVRKLLKEYNSMCLGVENRHF